MPKIKVVSYAHHDRVVSVRSDLMGKHREHCLCYSCEWFTPDDHEQNCTTANLLYAVCVELGLVLPVWECPEFHQKV